MLLALIVVASLLAVSTSVFGVLLLRGAKDIRARITLIERRVFDEDKGQGVYRIKAAVDLDEQDQLAGAFDTLKESKMALYREKNKVFRLQARSENLNSTLLELNRKSNSVRAKIAQIKAEEFAEEVLAEAEQWLESPVLCSTNTTYISHNGFYTRL